MWFKRDLRFDLGDDHAPPSKRRRVEDGRRCRLASYWPGRGRTRRGDKRSPNARRHQIPPSSPQLPRRPSPAQPRLQQASLQTFFAPLHAAWRRRGADSPTRFLWTGELMLFSFRPAHWLATDARVRRNHPRRGAVRPRSSVSAARLAARSGARANPISISRSRTRPSQKETWPPC